MKTKKKSKNTNLFIDIAEFDPSDFYTDKRDDKNNNYSSSKNVNDKTDYDSNILQHETILNSFEVSTQNSNTKKIFNDVDEYDIKRKVIRDKENANITEEIMQVDLSNDDTFIDDVINSYNDHETPVIVKEATSSLTFSPNSKKHEEVGLFKNNKTVVDIDDSFSLISNNELDKNSNSSILEDFIPTEEKDDVIDEDNNLFYDNDTSSKINNLKLALKNVSDNQNEINKTIQIVLNDVKKYKDDDNQMKTALEKNEIFKDENNFNHEDNFDLTNNSIKEANDISLNLENDNGYSTQQNISSNKQFTSSNEEQEDNVLEKKYNQIVNDIQSEKDSILVEAKKQIEIEKQKLMEEHEKLNKTLNERLEKDRDFINSQREMLLNVAEKEKQRLIDEIQHTGLIKEDDSDNNLIDVEEINSNSNDIFNNFSTIKNEALQSDSKILISELQNVLNELRTYKNKNNQSIQQEEFKSNELLSTNVTPIKSLDNNIQNDLNVHKQLNLEDEFINDDELRSLNKNRSYTEKVIDTIENDDYVNEEFIPIPTVPLNFENNVENKIKTKNFDSKLLSQDTFEFNDVDTMRNALRNQQDTDFGFEEKRREYEREKVKQEIKREIIDEINKLAQRDSNGFNLSNLTKSDNKYDDITDSIAYDFEEDDENKKDIDKDTELFSNSNQSISASKKNKTLPIVEEVKQMYNLDLFDDFNTEEFEVNDDFDYKKNKTTYLNNENYSSNIEKSSAPTSSVISDSTTTTKFGYPNNKSNFSKSKSRDVRLIFNKNNLLDENVSKSDFIKNYAKSFKRKLDKKKK